MAKFLIERDGQVDHFNKNYFESSLFKINEVNNVYDCIYDKTTTMVTFNVAGISNMSCDQCGAVVVDNYCANCDSKYLREEEEIEEFKNFFNL